MAVAKAVWENKTDEKKKTWRKPVRKQISKSVNVNKKQQGVVSKSHSSKKMEQESKQQKW